MPSPAPPLTRSPSLLHRLSHRRPLPVLFEFEPGLSELELFVEFWMLLDKVVACAVIGGGDLPLAVLFEEELLDVDPAFPDLDSLDFERLL